MDAATGNSMDGYSANMREHKKNCFQSYGISPSGAEQLANNEPPDEWADKLMYGAANPPDWIEAHDPYNTNCWLDSRDDPPQIPPREILPGKFSAATKQYEKENLFR